MNWFRNLRIGKKLSIGFSFAILLLAAVGVFGVWGSGEIYEKLEAALFKRLPAIDYLIESDRDLQQLLVAERSMIFENAKSERFKQFVADYDENLKQSRDRMAKFEALGLSEEEKTILEQYKKDRKAWEELSLKVKKGREEDTRDGRRLAIDLTLNQANAAFNKMRGHLDKLQEISLKLVEQYQEESKGTYRRTFWFSIIITACAILLVMFLLFLLNRTITVPVNRMLERTQRLSQGNADLTKRLQVYSNDEVGLLAQAFNQWSERLQGIISQVKSGSGVMIGTSEEIASGSQELATRTNQQAAAVTETTATLDSFTTIMTENARNITESSENINNLNADVQGKQELIKNVTNTMVDIDSSSKKIGNIMHVINDISFQTNLLALNAAVEAARAGEAGRGFAVVAAEVRNLAQKTAESSKTIQEIVNSNVESTERGMELVKETEVFFESIVDVLEKLSASVNQIENGTLEQSNGMEQINQTVSQLEHVINQNAQLVNDFAEAGQKMNDNAGKLQELMEEFQVGDEIKTGGPKTSSKISAPKSEPAPTKTKPAPPPPVNNKDGGDDFFSSDEEGYEEF